MLYKYHNHNNYNYEQQTKELEAKLAHNFAKPRSTTLEPTAPAAPPNTRTHSLNPDPPMLAPRFMRRNPTVDTHSMRKEVCVSHSLMMGLGYIRARGQGFVGIPDF